MKLKMPVRVPLTQSNFPLAQMYDPAAPEPADWQLLITLESTAAIPFLQAACSGTLTAVPPHEVLGQEYGRLSDTIPPSTGLTRLYLLPDPQTVSGIQDALGSALLGDALKWFVYDNVDTNFPAIVITDGLEKLDAQSPSGTPIEDKWTLFLTGQAGIHVNAGDTIGSASTQNATVPGRYRMKFGVFTSFGYVDPVVFFSAASAFVEGDAQSDTTALIALVGSHWPFLALDQQPATLAGEAALKLYPIAVLREALARLGLAPGGSDWRAVAKAQKVQYLERLVNNTFFGTGPFFRFCRDEMTNPFQLEAIVELFNYWKEPDVTPFQLEEGQTLSDLDEVNFTDADAFHLVLIDPFTHPLLGSPDLPKPDWSMLGQDLGADRTVCHPSVTIGADNHLTPDTYQGVMFLVHQGRVKRWDRWSSFTSHYWEDPQIDTPSCNSLTSSTQGNQKYRFRSRYSPTRTVNYCFAVWYDGNDSRILDTRKGTQSDYSQDAWAPGKFYYRVENGVTPVDLDGKTWVLIHFGHTRHDLIEPIDEEPDILKYFAYSGSAGCIVSPSFHKFRAEMCSLFMQYHSDGENDWFMKQVRAADTHNESLTLWDSVSIAYSQKAAWNDHITGTFWLIRPDEPARKD